MNTFIRYRRFSIHLLAILFLSTTLQSHPVLAASTADDIVVTIVSNRSTVRMGQTITYTVTVKNLGPDDASFVDVMHGLPSQLRLVSLTCDLGISPDTPFCEYSSLKAGETAVSVLVATPTAQLTHSRNLKVTASINFESADSFDPNMSNNRDSVSTRLIGKLP